MNFIKKKNESEGSSKSIVAQFEMISLGRISLKLKSEQIKIKSDQDERKPLCFQFCEKSSLIY